MSLLYVPLESGGIVLPASYVGFIDGVCLSEFVASDSQLTTSLTSFNKKEWLSDSVALLGILTRHHLRSDPAFLHCFALSASARFRRSFLHFPSHQ